MLLKHEIEPVDGQPIENTFRAIDERTGDWLGSSVIYTESNEVLFPVRPMEVRIQFSHSNVPDRLMGASVARAYELCRESGQMSRIFTQCAPDDQTLMDRLVPFGFEDTDGLVRMQHPLPSGLTPKVPAACAVVYDDLSDPTEREFFLERYNTLYNVKRDLAWLKEFIDRPDFMRILTVASTGLAGEILIWREGDAGIIGYIQTSKRWRRMGVGSCMISLACEAFEQLNLKRAESNIRVRYPHVLNLMNSTGFVQDQLLMRYPGIDVNP